MKPSSFIWHQGAFVPWERATVHVLAHALHYGSSIFEGIRVYETQAGPHFFRLDAHLKRFFESARIHRMKMTYSARALRTACREVIERNHLTSAYVRPVAYHDYGTLGVVPESPVSVSIAAFEWGAYLGDTGKEQGIDVCVSSWQRPAANTIPTLAKAGGNYLVSARMSEEAYRNGYREAIALDSQGFLSEGPAENLFLVRDGILYTPAIHQAILLGITRDSVLTLAHGLGIETREQCMPREFLYLADEIFLTGTAAELVPVRSVDGMEIGSGRPGPMTRRLQERLFSIFQGCENDPLGWLQPVAAYVDTCFSQGGVS